MKFTTFIGNKKDNNGENRKRDMLSNEVNEEKTEISQIIVGSKRRNQIKRNVSAI